MTEKDTVEVNRLFATLIETIEIMLNSDFYCEATSLAQDKIIAEDWYDAYKKTNSLNTINIEKLKELDTDISTIFDKYIEIEPVSHNYAEIIDYYFEKLKRYWKDDLKSGGKKNSQYLH